MSLLVYSTMIGLWGFLVKGFVNPSLISVPFSIDNFLYLQTTSREDPTIMKYYPSFRISVRNQKGLHHGYTIYVIYLILYIPHSRESVVLYRVGLEEDKSGNLCIETGAIRFVSLVNKRPCWLKRDIEAENSTTFCPTAFRCQSST